MIKDPLSKLYKHMTSKELAALAFANLANNDPLEEARISDAVPRHTYICLDATFRQHLDSIFNMACCWSIQYWQCKSYLLASNGVLLAHLHDKTATDQLTKDDDIVELFAQQIAALELALDEVCHEYHIDINAPHLRFKREWGFIFRSIKTCGIHTFSGEIRTRVVIAIKSSFLCD